jgi:uridine kinase
MGEPDGMRIYRRSLTFLLAAAFEEMFPGAKLTVDHSVASGGYFCQVQGRPALSSEELDRLEGRMEELVGRPAFPRTGSSNRPSKTFAGAAISTKSPAQAPASRSSCIRSANIATHHGYMLRTGMLKWFGLVLTGGGFTLRFRDGMPPAPLPLPEYPKLLAAFRQYGDTRDAGVAYAAP